MQHFFTNLIVLFKIVSIHIVESQILCLESTSSFFLGPGTGFNINYEVCSLTIANRCFPIRQWFSNFNRNQHHLKALLKFRLLGYALAFLIRWVWSETSNSAFPSSAQICWSYWSREQTLRTSVLHKGSL